MSHCCIVGRVKLVLSHIQVWVCVCVKKWWRETDWLIDWWREITSNFFPGRKDSHSGCSRVHGILLQVSTAAAETVRLASEWPFVYFTSPLPGKYHAQNLCFYFPFAECSLKKTSQRWFNRHPEFASQSSGIWEVQCRGAHVWWRSSCYHIGWCWSLGWTRKKAGFENE